MSAKFPGGGGGGERGYDHLADSLVEELSAFKSCLIKLAWTVDESSQAYFERVHDRPNDRHLVLGGIII